MRGGHHSPHSLIEPDLLSDFESSRCLRIASDQRLTLNSFVHPMRPIILPNTS